jgi:hypothetical protein
MNKRVIFADAVLVRVSLGYVLQYFIYVSRRQFEIHRSTSYMLAIFNAPIDTIIMLLTSSPAIASDRDSDKVSDLVCEL